MKKTKMMLGILLAAVLTVSCLAFAACGEAATATDEEVRAFMESVTEHAQTDAETGLPGYVSGLSYSVSLSGTGKTGGLQMNTTLTGTVNLTSDPSFRLDSSVSTGIAGVSSAVTMGAVYTDHVLYIATSVNAGGTVNESVKMKTEFPSVPMTGGMIDVDGLLPWDGDEILSVDDFVSELKAAGEKLGEAVDPKIYIDGRTMKVALNETNYYSVAFDENWILERVVYEFDNAFLLSLARESLGGLDSMGGLGSVLSGSDMSYRMEIARTDATEISAPADADEYTTAGAMLPSAS